MSDSVRPHRWQPTRLPRPWDSPGKNTGVGCHCLLGVYEPRTSKCISWVLERQGNQRSSCQHFLDHGDIREFQKNIYFCFIGYAKDFDCMDHNKLLKILKEMSIPGHPTCLLRSMWVKKQQQLESYMGQLLLLLLSCFSHIQLFETP